MSQGKVLRHHLLYSERVDMVYLLELPLHCATTTPHPSRRRRVMMKMMLISAYQIASRYGRENSYQGRSDRYLFQITSVAPTTGTRREEDEEEGGEIDLISMRFFLRALGSAHLSHERALSLVVL